MKGADFDFFFNKTTMSKENETKRSLVNVMYVKREMLNFY